jgi:hypothetical protein
MSGGGRPKLQEFARALLGGVLGAAALECEAWGHELKGSR